MRKKRLSLLLLTICLLISSLMPSSGRTTSALAEGQKKNTHQKLLIFYGIPEGINNVWDVEKAAAIIARYDVVVLGAGLEEKEHDFHKSTKDIIDRVHQLSPDTLIFGYIDLGVTTDNHPMWKIEHKVKAWKATGANGILFDDCGFDFGVTRKRFNDAVRIVHRESMPVFINAWNPDDVFSSKVHKKYNPSGARTLLGPNDFYLAESLVLPTDITKPKAPSGFGPNFRKKMDKMIMYRSVLGTKMMGISRYVYADHSKDAVRKFFRMTEVTASVFSLNGYGVAGYEYSSEEKDENVALDFPYIANYEQHYEAKPKYTAKYNDRDFTRGPFRIHSLPGDHYYKFPGQHVN